MCVCLCVHVYVCIAVCAHAHRIELLQLFMSYFSYHTAATTCMYSTAIITLMYGPLTYME